MQLTAKESLFLCNCERKGWQGLDVLERLPQPSVYSLVHLQNMSLQYFAGSRLIGRRRGAVALYHTRVCRAHKDSLVYTVRVPAWS